MSMREAWRYPSGLAAFGRYAAVVLLGVLLAGPAKAQNVRSWAAGFSLAEAGARAGRDVDGEGRSTLTRIRERTTIRLASATGRGGLFPSGPVPAPALKNASGKVPKPPVRTTRVAAQILAGAAAGVLGCAVVALTASESTVDDDQAYIAAMTAGGLVAGALVTPGLVYLIGSGGRQTGSLGVTYLGGLAGAAVCAIIFAAASSSDADGAGEAVLAGAVLIPAIGSVIGFITTRRYKSLPAVQTALLNVGQGKLKLGIPAPQVFFSGFGKKSQGLAVRIFQAEL